MVSVIGNEIFIIDIIINIYNNNSKNELEYIKYDINTTNNKINNNKGLYCSIL